MFPFIRWACNCILLRFHESHRVCCWFETDACDGHILHRGFGSGYFVGAVDDRVIEKLSAILHYAFFVNHCLKMDEAVEAVEEVKRQWSKTQSQTQELVKEIEEFGKQRGGSGEKNSLPRLNGLAHDGLAMLESLQLKLDVLVPQLPTYDEAQSAQSAHLRLALRSATLQAKANTRKAFQEERERLLGGGQESTIRRRNLQTKAGMTSAAESITDSLRRARQIMTQEVQRSTNTLATFEESTGVLKKAEKEYDGHSSLLMRTRNLLSTMQRQDVLDRIILAVGFILFTCAVLYVVSKRIGLLRLQQQVTSAVKAGMVKEAHLGPGGAGDVNVVNHGNVVPDVGVRLDNAMHDEL
ncbi:hypothetical protein AKJ16_DCAP06689 [Drosera capensis]